MSRASTKRRIRKPVRAPEKTNMEDREGNARPTPERIAQGRYRLVEVADDASAAYAVDEAEGNAAIMFASGQINAAQREAADKFEEMAHAVLGSPSQRSCLDFSPVGHEPDDLTEQQVAEARKRKAEWDAVHHAAGKCYGALSDAFWDNTTPDVVNVRKGLDRLCLLWKIRA